MTTNVQEILKEIQKRKGKYLEDALQKIKEGKIIHPKSLDELEKEEKSEFKIKTNTFIDDILGGGIPEGKSALFYGEFRTGKTQTCFTATCLCPDYVIYIDTENSFRLERIRQICEARGLNYQEVKKKIIYYPIKDWVEQMMLIYSLPSPADIDKKISLIICDSIAKHFRGVEFVGRENLQTKNGFIREFILSLERYAKMHRAALIYTTQIYEVPSVTPYVSKVDVQKPVGGPSQEHQPDFIVFFRKAKGNIRIATAVDSSYRPLAERVFIINEKGIDVLPEESKAFKTLQQRTKEFEKKQQQEKIKPKRKKE